MERNPVRIGLVNRAREWEWSSLSGRLAGRRNAEGLLSCWPIGIRRNWVLLVNRPQTDAELADLRRSVRSPALGSRWIAAVRRTIFSASGHGLLGRMDPGTGFPCTARNTGSGVHHAVSMMRDADCFRQKLLQQEGNRNFKDL